MDYCNLLLAGTSAKNIEKLQTVQNLLARVVTGTKRRDHIKPALKTLHWLPIAEWIQYKVALITHKMIVTQQPKYLADIASIYRPTRDLRSSFQQVLHLSNLSQDIQSLTRRGNDCLAAPQTWYGMDYFWICEQRSALALSNLSSRQIYLRQRIICSHCTFSAPVIRFL